MMVRVMNQKILYILEFGYKESKNEMKKRGIGSVEEACNWIEDKIEYDLDYNNIGAIYSSVNIIYYDGYDEPSDFYAVGYIQIECPINKIDVLEKDLDIICKIRDRIVLI